MQPPTKILTIQAAPREILNPRKSKREVLLLGVLILSEQVSDVLVVNLEVGDPDQELDVVLRLGDGAEDVGERVGDDPLELGHRAVALHGERLARARLAVGEDCAVVTLQHILHDRPVGAFSGMLTFKC